MQIMQFLLVGLYPELGSGGNYIEMHYNEEEILMRRQGWKNITQSKRNKSFQRQNTNDSTTTPFDCLSCFKQSLEIHTWQLPGTREAEVTPLVATVWRAGPPILSPDKVSTSFDHFGSFMWCKWQKNLALRATRVSSFSQAAAFWVGKTALPKMLNCMYFHVFPLNSIGLYLR